jgi:Peptidase M15
MECRDYVKALTIFLKYRVENPERRVGSQRLRILTIRRRCGREPSAVVEEYTEMRLGQLTIGGTARGAPRKQLSAVLTAIVGLLGLLCLNPAAALAESDSGDWVKGVFGNSVTASRASKLGGPVTSTERRASRSKGTQVASLGTSRTDESPSRRAPVTSGRSGNVNWVASSGCLNGTLRSVLNNLAASYGSITVSSTCRSASHNRRVGGAPRSMHLSGDAADFRIHGNVGAAYASLRSNGSVGGLKHYGGGLYHIDTGARRSW